MFTTVDVQNLVRLAAAISASRQSLFSSVLARQIAEHFAAVEVAVGYVAWDRRGGTVVRVTASHPPRLAIPPVQCSPCQGCHVSLIDGDRRLLGLTRSTESRGWFILLSRETRPFRPRQLSAAKMLLECMERWPLPDASVDQMAPRKLEVLSHLQAGLAEKEISSRMGLSHHTVHVYVKSIYREFSVNSRAELMSLWVHPKRRKSVLRPADRPLAVV